jgi:DNA repair exonuclease SbcCD nuclease subunit
MYKTGKVIEIGDYHVGKFHDFETHKSFWFDFLKPMCDDQTTIIFTGDIFDDDRNIDTMFIYETFALFSDISKTVKEFIFYVGNHDTHKRENIHINMCCMLSAFPNGHMKIYCVEDLNGLKVGYLSYNHDLDFLKEKIKEFKEIGVDVLYTHCDIEELVFDNGAPIEYGLKKEVFSGIPRVVNGHIHKRQFLENIENIGSPMQMKFSDSKNVCGVNVIENGVVTFVENNSSPKYTKLTFEEFISSEKTLLSNKHIWVTDVTDVELVKEKLKGVDYVSIRTKFIETNETSTDDQSQFDYHHDSDPLEEVDVYLASIGSINYKDSIINIDGERIKRVSKILKDTQA